VVKVFVLDFFVVCVRYSFLTDKQNGLFLLIPFNGNPYICKRMKQNILCSCSPLLQKDPHSFFIYYYLLLISFNANLVLNTGCDTIQILIQWNCRKMQTNAVDTATITVTNLQCQCKTFKTIKLSCLITIIINFVKKNLIIIINFVISHQNQVINVIKTSLQQNQVPKVLKMTSQKTKANSKSKQNDKPLIKIMLPQHNYVHST